MENIQKALQSIEQEKEIKILYACETGSRAWGFPSPDSDYDIRFIYRHDKDWYLSLNERKDTIETMQGDLDITGWDIRKSLVLLKKSNAALIERFMSPVVYFSAPSFKENFLQLIQIYYTPVAVFHHHYSLAQKFWEDIKDRKEIKLKSYFYLLRSLLSCNWIVQRNDVPPMDIEGLMTLIEESYRTKLRELVQLKSTVGESYLYAVDSDLDAWIHKLWITVEPTKYKLAANSADYTHLNAFFLKILNDAVND